MSAFSSACVECTLTFEDLRDALVGAGPLDVDAKCRTCHLLAGQHKKGQGKFQSQNISLPPLTIVL